MIFIELVLEEAAKNCVKLSYIQESVNPPEESSLH